MARNALRADDVSWLLHTVKIPQCVAFGCSKGLLKLILVSFLVFAWLLQPKATHYGILTVRTNHDTSSARSALRAIQDGYRADLWKPIEKLFR